MTIVNLNLDGDALREATVQAMMGVLTPETKTKIIENAIQTLLSPSTNSWEKKKSPIEIAFERAIDKIAHEEALRLASEDNVLRDKLKALLKTTADKIFETDIDKLAERMANAFVSSMRRD